MLSADDIAALNAGATDGTWPAATLQGMARNFSSLTTLNVTVATVGMSA